MKKKSLLIIAILSFIVLAGCAKAAATQSAAYDVSKSANAPALSEAPMPQSASENTSGVSSDSAAAGGYADASRNTEVKQMVIKNASLTILVDDPLKTLSDIMKLGSDMGGFTVTSNSYQTYTASGDQVPEASVTIRVPAEDLNDALDKIEKMTGDPSQYVTNESVSGQDVTQEYTDLNSRLKNLEEAETELTKMYEKAEKSEDVLAIYNQKMQVTEQIEVIKGQMQYYEQSAAMSAISVQITAKASVQPITVAGWEPKGVARNAIQALINFLKGFVDFLIWLAIYILPILIIIGTPLFFFIRWLVRRKHRKQEESRKMPPMPVEKK